MDAFNERVDKQNTKGRAHHVMQKLLCFLTIFVVLPVYSHDAGGSNPGSDINSSVGSANSSSNTTQANEPVGPDSDSGLDSNDQGNPYFPNTNSSPSPHNESSNPSVTQPTNNLNQW